MHFVQFPDFKSVELLEFMEVLAFLLHIVTSLSGQGRMKWKNWTLCLASDVLVLGQGGFRWDSQSFELNIPVSSKSERSGLGLGTCISSVTSLEIAFITSVKRCNMNV